MDREMVQGPGQHSSVIRTALIAVFMACTLAGQAAWASGETDAALQAYRDGNYPAAIKIWRKLAANDNPDAQYALGVAYLKGHGIVRDTRKAVRWFQMAAKSQHRLAEALVAYQAGAFDTAVALWKNEAQRGTTDAQYALGLVLLKGQGVRRNPKQSLQWFGVAAKAGNTAAMFNLGGMYWEGIGTTADPTMAVYWWNRAAEKRDPASQFNLGLAYYFGRGVPRNPAQATFWIQMSETNGYLGARSVLGLMQRGMLIGGLHLRPGDDAVAGGIAALETSRHESIAVSGTVMTTQQPVATVKIPDDVQPRATTKQAAADDPEGMRQLRGKLTTANTLNAELSRKLDTATVTNQTLQQQREKLTTANTLNAELSRKLDTATVTNQTLQQQREKLTTANTLNAALSQKLDTATVTSQTLQQQREKLRNSLTIAKATNAALVAEKKALSKKLADATKVSAQLSQEINIAQAANQTLKQQYEKLIATLAAVDATNAALVNENQTLSARDSVLGQQRTQEKKTETSLNTQLENTTTAYIALETTNKAILNEKLILTTNLNSLTQRLAEQANEKTALNDQINTLTTTHQELETTNKAILNEKLILTTNLNSLTQRLAEQANETTALNDQINTLTKTHQKLETTNKAILNEKLILTTNLNSLTQRLAEQANETTALNDQINTLTTTHQELETTNITLIEKKKISENRIEELQSLLKKNKDSAAALATKIDGLKEHQQVIIASEKALTAQKVLLEQALDQQRLSAELLETDNISLINRVQLLEKQESAALARADKSGQTDQSLTQPNSHSDRSKLSTEAIDSFNNGLTLTTQGRFDEAIKVYEELIKAFPRFPQPYNNLAGVFASLGNLERAESLLRQGLELDDRYRLLRKNLGSLLIHRASRIYREAIDGEKNTNVSAQKVPIALQAFDMLSPLQ